MKDAQEDTNLQFYWETRNKKHHDDQNVNNITNLGNDLLHELHNLKMGMIMNMTGENTPNFDLLNKNIFEAKKQIEILPHGKCSTQCNGDFRN